MAIEDQRAAGSPARLEAVPAGGPLRASGDWVIGRLDAVDAEIRSLIARGGAARIDVSGVSRLDTAGAWLILRAAHAAGGLTAIAGASQNQRILLEEVGKYERGALVARAHANPFLDAVARLGRALVHARDLAIEMLGFSGLMLSVAGGTIVGRRRLRINSVVHNIESAGFDAVPIITLISFLVGSVISFMSADVLKEYGGGIFTVDLIAVAFFREFGVLLAAIMIAGRSGSAYTAEIGAMTGHEEIDAMRALALDPIEILVIPRMAALLVSLPLLTFIADIMGLVGGGVVTWVFLDLDPQSFVNRLLIATGADNFWAGMIKAPFFAFLIAMIGCFQGFKVTGTAESVGERTTMSVVQSIFIVIVFDALFAMFYQQIGF